MKVKAHAGICIAGNEANELEAAGCLAAPACDMEDSTAFSFVNPQGRQPYAHAWAIMVSMGNHRQPWPVWVQF